MLTLCPPTTTCAHDCPLLWMAAAAAKSLQSCPTLCTPTDGSPPGSPVPGILQARVREWVAIAFSALDGYPRPNRTMYPGGSDRLKDLTSDVSARHRPTLGAAQADPSWPGLHLLCALGPSAWDTL